MCVKLPHSLRVFENRALKGFYGNKGGGEVTGGWRKLRNEVLRNLCSAPNIITVIKKEMGRAYTGEKCIHSFGGKN
jgi:hypothetical protein